MPFCKMYRPTMVLRSVAFKYFRTVVEGSHRSNREVQVVSFSPDSVASSITNSTAISGHLPS